MVIIINGKKFEGNCVSIGNNSICISSGEKIEISAIKEKEIHIHGDVQGDVDGTNITVYGDVKGDVDGTNVTIKGSSGGNIDAVNVTVMGKQK